MHIDPRIPVEPPDTEGAQSRPSALLIRRKSRASQWDVVPGSEALNEGTQTGEGAVVLLLVHPTRPVDLLGQRRRHRSHGRKQGNCPKLCPKRESAPGNTRGAPGQSPRPSPVRSDAGLYPHSHFRCVGSHTVSTTTDDDQCAHRWNTSMCLLSWRGVSGRVAIYVLM